MSEPIKVGKYEFTEMDEDGLGGRIRFEVRSGGRHIISKDDEKEILTVLDCVGYWEKMIVSGSHILRDLGLSTPVREIEKVNMEEYHYDAKLDSGSRIPTISV